MDYLISNSQFEKDRSHLLHPYASFPDFLETGSRFFDSADGVHVHGADGKNYLDGVAGLWCVNIGYGRQEMADAIAEQALKLPYYNTFTDMSSGPAADLADKLAELAPGDINHVFFTTGGSMSVDSSVRIAHYYFHANGQPEKRKVIARENGYHGSTFLSASVTGIKPFGERFHTLTSGDDPLVHHVSCPNIYRPKEDLEGEAYCDALIEELEEMIQDIGAEQIACFVAEPIIGAGGVIVAPDGYHKRVLEVCRSHNILYVSDEVITAFGRLGHIFASEKEFDIVPDMITTAKGISSGYIPLGAVLLSEKIYQGISNPSLGGGVFTHGFTYSGHPVACAAGLKNLEIMERENMCEYASEAGQYLHSSLSSLIELENVGDVRGRGLMAGIELVQDKSTKAQFDLNPSMGKRVARAAYERGLIVRVLGDIVALSPPLTISNGQIDQLVDTLRDSILEVGSA